MITSATKRHPFDLILPGLLLALVLLDLLVGLSKGNYPTQATPLSVLSGLLGLYLANSLRRLPSSLSVRNMPEEENDPEGRAIDFANARLNRMLGAGLLIFGTLFNIFWLVSIITVRPTQVYSVGENNIGRLVEAGILILFIVLPLAVQFAGAKIYHLGRQVDI
jgi:hypothetical protein